MAVVSDLEAVHRDVVAIMKRHYGDRLATLMLFGSYARGDFHEDSDIDYLVVLTDEAISLSREISALSPTLSQYFLNYNVWISAKVTTKEVYLNTIKPFFAEVRREAKVIYDAKFSFLPEEI
ncbi:nucleotidyltransferase domain-containing protein [Nibrella saemangeumensis]|uniref:Nucleotidyltransferase domain-containing protein n=1 Tax=Nibrella saemangeumensis TaxID=1084526 RepID=A0ABP8NMS5_9BACT